MSAPVIVWIRNDLRLDDNPALISAVASGHPVLPIFIWDEEIETMTSSMGSASRIWLHASLQIFKVHLEEYNLHLLTIKGPTKKVIQSIIQKTGACSIVWNRRIEPHLLQLDTDIKAYCKSIGVMATSYRANLLIEPFPIQNKTITTREGKPFQVFTPFWKTAQQIINPEPLDFPGKSNGYLCKDIGSSIDELGLLSGRPWEKGIMSHWNPGETNARAHLKEFIKQRLESYQELRDYPAVPGTSKLSPHLHFGEISVQRIYQEVNGKLGSDFFVRELGWREFAHHLLYHFPETVNTPLRSEFTKFPWESNDSHLKAWQQGKTGYPIIDAGMRELWTTGWMHNRVRMIVGSFLVKHLLISWKEGASWFQDTLVDADLANNTFGWQWVSGSGADAAPYFRIFNPVLQGQKFDPKGIYVKKFIPELTYLPEEQIHTPWLLSKDKQRQYGIQIGHTYPAPIISLEEGRTRALSAFDMIKKRSENIRNS